MSTSRIRGWSRPGRGGLILTPWANTYFDGGLLALTIDADGMATGGIVGKSWFMCGPDDRGFAVQRHGPRRLWDEIEAAHRWWVSTGSPDADRWRFTVTSDGQRAELQPDPGS